MQELLPLLPYPFSDRCDVRSQTRRRAVRDSVSVDLFSRAVSSQVFSALQSLTSVFGMGTGGPFALKTLTYELYVHRKPNKEY